MFCLGMSVTPMCVVWYSVMSVTPSCVVWQPWVSCDAHRCHGTPRRVSRNTQVSVVWYPVVSCDTKVCHVTPRSVSCNSQVYCVVPTHVVWHSGASCDAERCRVTNILPKYTGSHILVTVVLASPVPTCDDQENNRVHASKYISMLSILSCFVLMKNLCPCYVFQKLLNI